MTHHSNRIETFHQLVSKKYNVYNALFLSLPFQSVAKTGMLLPLLAESCRKGLAAGMEPVAIINSFFATNTQISDEKDQIDFLFRVIQYVERQIVLFDAIEDAAFLPVMQKGQNQSIREMIKSIDEDDERQQFFEKLNRFGIRLVFTAHPTQFYPEEILGIIERLRYNVQENDIDNIDETLRQLGLTSFLRKEKPTPFQEAQNIIYFLRNVYYEAIADYFNALQTDLAGMYPFDNTSLIQIGFWPGGDRDGNPFVTAETTHKVADTLRITLMKCYYQDIKKLQKKLTFRGVKELVQTFRNKLYPTLFDARERFHHEDMLSILEEIRELLITKFNSLYLHELTEFINRVKIFKSHFATIDIRQDHRVHATVMEAIRTKHQILDKSFDSLSAKDLTRLIETVDLTLNHVDFEDQLVRDTIENISRLKEIQEKNGEAGCNRYIISNSENSHAVLYVLALFKWCGWDLSTISFDIIPLFETMVGMAAASDAMSTLFNLPVYRSHISNRGDKQTIMLGFSDGTKDGGYLQANWMIYKTKEKLTAVCRKHEIDTIFFDGRGGPPARGGGKTHRFYASLGSQIANNEIQLTIQGQTITSTYGTRDQFIYNCEQMLTAGLINHLPAHHHYALSTDARTTIDELSSLSLEYYQELKSHPLFISYLEELSTLRFYVQAKIGSRPGKRGRTAKLTLDDLRAISFVGAWSQLKQNVPGYYGLGYALEAFKKAGRLEEVKQLFKSTPYFKAIVLNSMMSMYKSNFGLTSYMQHHQKFGKFWELIKEEYERTRRLVLEIADYDILMQEEAISRNSIEIRENIVLPLLVIQQFALQKIAVGDRSIELYEKMVLRSLYGNVNASRNSA